MTRIQKNMLAGMLALSLAVLHGQEALGESDKPAREAKKKHARHEKKEAERPKGVAAKLTGRLTRVTVQEQGKEIKVYAIEVRESDGPKSAKGKTIPLYGGPRSLLQSLDGKDVVVGGVLINKDTEFCVISIAAAPEQRPVEQKPAEKKPAEKK